MSNSDNGTGTPVDSGVATAPAIEHKSMGSVAKGIAKDIVKGAVTGAVAGAVAGALAGALEEAKKAVSTVADAKQETKADAGKAAPETKCE
jgi:hypothetical protein